MILHSSFPVSCREYIRQDGAADGVPSTTDGARYHSHWVGSNEESHSEIRAKSCVLHSHFDGDSTFLSCGEMTEIPHRIAKDIADGVVTKNHDKSKDEE